jgi:hypothetical protein
MSEPTTSQEVRLTHFETSNTLFDFNDEIATGINK